MASDNRVSKVIVGYELDRKGVQDVVKSADTIQAAEKDVEKSLDRLGPAAQSAVNKIDQQFDRLDRTVDDAISDARRLEDAYERVGRVNATPNLRGVGEFADNAGSRASQLLSGLGLGDAANTTGVLADLGASIATLSPTGLAATAAMVGVGLVLGDLQQRAAAFQAAQQQRVENDRGIAELLASGATVQDFQAVIDSREQEANALQRQRDSYQATLDAFEEFEEGVRAGGGTAQEMFAQIAAERLRILNETGLSVDTMQAEVDRLNSTVLPPLLQFIKDLGFAAKSPEVVQNTGVQRAVGILNTVFNEFIPSLAEKGRNVLRILGEDRTERIEDANKAFIDAGNKIAPAQANLTSASNALAAAQTNAATAIAAAEQRVTDAERKGVDERNRIIESANDRVRQLADDYGIDRVRAEEDLRRELNKIGVTIIDETAERDALGAFQAKRQLAEAKETGTIEASRRREDYQRRLRELALQTSRELSMLQTRINNEVAAARAAVDIERQKHNAEITMRQQALNAAIQQYSLFYQQLQNAARNLGTAAGSGTSQAIIPNTVQLSGGTPYERFVAYQRSQNVPGFAGGLERVPYDNFIARLHKDERVQTKWEADQTRLMRQPGTWNSSKPTAIRLKLDGTATTRLLEGKVVDVLMEVFD